MTETATTAPLYVVAYDDGADADCETFARLSDAIATAHTWTAQLMRAGSSCVAEVFLVEDADAIATMSSEDGSFWDVSDHAYRVAIDGWRS